MNLSVPDDHHKALSWPLRLREEDLIHFLIECKHLENKRNTNLINNIKKEKTKILQVRKLLFNLKQWDKIAEMIQQMWNERKRIIEQQRKNNNT